MFPGNLQYFTGAFSVNTCTYNYSIDVYTYILDHLADVFIQSVRRLKQETSEQLKAKGLLMGSSKA